MYLSTPYCTDRSRASGTASLVLALWTVLAIPAFPATNTADAVTATNPALAPLVWLHDLPQGLLDARANYRAAVLLFTSADCPWCFRLQRDVLSDPEVRSALAHYTLVELDTAYHEDQAYLYGVAGVPALLVVNNEGMVRRYLGGYRPKAEVLRFLTAGLNLPDRDQNGMTADDLLKRLGEGTLTEEQWPALLRAMARKESRNAIRAACVQSAGTNRNVLVRLLNHPHLPVRLGALEILEEMTGDNRGYDPWLAPTATVNRAALGRWQAWGAGTGECGQVYAALSEQEVAGLIADLAGEDEQRALRARRMMSLGGPGAIGGMQEYIRTHPDLAPGVMARLKAVYYALLIPDVVGVDPYELAHRLVMGNLDMRLKALRTLQSAGRAALPILVESLAAPDPMVRETAVDVLVKAAGRDAVPWLERLAADEKDPNVVHALIRGLGNVRSRRGLKILTNFLAAEREDIVVAAIESVAKLRSTTVKGCLQKALADPRWRVRAAALQAAGALGLKDLTGEVEGRLADGDEFVRYTAVQTIIALEARNASGKLADLFAKDDRLKGPIVAAYVTLDMAIPPSFQNALKSADPETILAVLEGLSSDGARGLPLALAYANHTNLDVACRALQILATHGMNHPDSQRVLAETLERGESVRSLTILRAIEPQRSDQHGSGETTITIVDGIAVSSPDVTDLVAAFGGNAPPAPAETAPPAPEAVKVDDLLAAFTDTAPPGPATNGAPGEAPAQPADKRLINAARKLMESSGDPTVRIQSAVLLLCLGQIDGLPAITNAWAELTDGERQRVAAGLAPLAAKPPVLPLIQRMLAGEDETLREQALGMCFQPGVTETRIHAVFEELTRRKTPLRPLEVYNGHSRMDRNDAENRRHVRRWVVQLLKWDYPAPLQCLGLALLNPYYRRGDAELLERFYASENPWLRRAAFYAAGRNQTAEEFEKRLPAIRADSSEYVRMVIPAIGGRASGARWLHYFSADQFGEGEYENYGDAGRRRSDAMEAALQAMTTDVSPRVRFEAFMALLHGGGTVDLAALLRTMNDFTDQETISQRVSEYLQQNYAKLDRHFAILLPYLQQARYRGEEIEKIYDHFGSAAAATNLVVLSRSATLTVTVTDTPAAGQAVDTNAPFNAVVFEKQGCPDCRRVRAMVGEAAAEWPGLRVEYHDIATVAAMRLNERYSEWFEVAPERRLVAPAVFAGAGALVRTEITRGALRDLLRRSAALPAEWYQAPAAAGGDAGRAIESRFAAMTFGLVGLSGLLDGINPCAFATLIFFLSYLQIARRKPGEILRIGMAFVAGVFLAYFVLGAGLLEIVSRFTPLRPVQYALNAAMGFFMAVVIVLNIRDGILCLRGRMEEMTLQLPAVLKRGTHAVIRHGARLRHFVIGAFLVGAAIAILELACTGQVYAPTIMYMLKTGAARGQALLYLFWYNLCFIAPLLVVFVAAFQGLRSEGLTEWLRRHAAAVKFGTALLFLVLLVLFLFVQHW